MSAGYTIRCRKGLIAAMYSVAEQPVRLDEDGHLRAVAAAAVRDPAEVQHAVHGPVGDLGGEFVVGQVERRERERRRSPGRAGRRADRPAAGRAGSARASRRPCPGRPSRRARRASTAAPRARVRRERSSARGRPRASPSTSRWKSSGPPGVGSAHTSSSRKSGVISWIRQGREVCALFGSLM